MSPAFFSAEVISFFESGSGEIPCPREYFIPIRAVFYKTDSYFYYTPEREFVNRIPFMPGFISSPSKSPGSSRRLRRGRSGRSARGEGSDFQAVFLPVHQGSGRRKARKDPYPCRRGRSAAPVRREHGRCSQARPDSSPFILSQPTGTGSSAP